MVRSIDEIWKAYKSEFPDANRETFYAGARTAINIIQEIASHKNNDVVDTMASKFLAEINR